MDVGIVVKDFPPDMVGGTETQTKRMASELERRGHKVTVFTKKYGEHDDTDVDFDVVRVWNLRWSPFISTLTFLFFCLFKIIRRSSNFDCLHCMMVYPVGFLGYVNKKFTGLPYFAWIRGGDYYFMKDVGWKRWMIKKVLGDTLVLVQSNETEKDVKEDFSKIQKKLNLKILGNGVNIPEDTASGDYVLFLGRLASLKGVEYLVRAAQDIDSKIVIVGDGDKRDELEELSNELEVDNKIDFTGYVDPDKVDEYYLNASIFTLPSIEGEGLPNAVLEAMSTGLPVVATDSGGLPNVIEDGENGFIVPMRDPDSLAEKINHLIRNPEKRSKMGKKAREYVVENHSWESILDELEDVYQEVVSK